MSPRTVEELDLTESVRRVRAAVAKEVAALSGPARAWKVVLVTLASFPATVPEYSGAVGWFETREAALEEAISRTSTLPYPEAQEFVVRKA